MKLSADMLDSFVVHTAEISTHQFWSVFDFIPGYVIDFIMKEKSNKTHISNVLSNTFQSSIEVSIRYTASLFLTEYGRAKPHKCSEI